mgnify:CR=1 FL=1
MKKTAILISAFLLWLSLAGSAMAENFDITNYDVEINVNKDKSAFITETIDANFFYPSHGIYREIPSKNATVTDISVSERNKKSRSMDKTNIKIGDPHQLITGPHRYIIQYRYNYYDGKDEFYHNIIGTEWKTNINRASFKVVLPEPVDSSQVGLSIGQYGTAGFDGDAIYHVDGRVIFGETARALAPYEGITLRVEVPHGYFKFRENPIKKYTIPGLFLLTIIAFMTWFIHGKDDQVIPFVNFYPIKGLNAIENELAYKGKASTQGIVALLVELAQKGCIKIETHGTSWTLHKLKEPTDLDDNQLDLLKAIFGGSKTKVTKGDLETSRSFYKNCRDIIKDVNKKRSKIFYASSISFKLRALMTACCIGVLVLTFLPVFNFSVYELFQNFPVLLFPLIALIVLYSTIASSNRNWLQIIFIIIWSIGFGGVPLMLLLTNAFTLENRAVTVFGAICLVISAICTYQLPRRNPRGQSFLEHLKGLKKFIEVAEKPKLQQLVKQDPQYFYNILPMAYIFGISDKWIKQFEDITKLTPEWYSGTHLSSTRFNDFTRSFSSVSVPSTANGGISRSSGGGGFSGGGGGGGGGGSW